MYAAEASGLAKLQRTVEVGCESIRNTPGIFRPCENP